MSWRILKRSGVGCHRLPELLLSFLAADCTNGKMIASGQTRNGPAGDAKTFVGSMTETGVTPDLILPSGGDCSYPSMVWHDNKLWLTYYSGHEGKTIYLAKTPCPTIADQRISG